MSQHPNLDSFLIVRFVDGERGIWKIASGPCERRSERHHTERHTAVDKLTRNIRLLKNQAKANVLKTIYKHFPAAEEISAVHDDDRLEANRLCDLGEVYHGEFREYGGKFTYDCRMTLRRDANNEYIYPDGTLDSLVNVLTGEKYPVPGEGEGAYRISYIYQDGVSGSDYHEIIIAKTPREAVEKLLTMHEQQFAENPDNFFGGLCTRDKLLSSSAENIHTNQHTWFSGPDLVEDDQAKAMTGLFGALASGDADELNAMMNSVMQTTAAKSIGFMRDPFWKGEDNQ